MSLTGSPIPEAAAAIDILRAVGLRTGYVNVVSCPTCGRTGIDVAAIARRVESELADIRVPLTVAVMGAWSMAPARRARRTSAWQAGGLSRAGGSAGGEGSSYAVGAIFEKGKAPEKVEGDLAAILIERTRGWPRNGPHRRKRRRERPGKGVSAFSGPLSFHTGGRHQPCLRLTAYFRM